MGMLEEQQLIDEMLRALDREYHFLAILRTSHPDYLYTTLGPFDTVEEVYEAKERFKADLHLKLGPLYWKIIPKFERSTVDMPIERYTRLAINKRIKEDYSFDSQPES